MQDTRGEVVLNGDLVAGVTALYFEGDISAREGAGDRVPCAIQLGGDACYFVAVGDRTTAIDFKVGNIASVKDSPADGELVIAFRAGDPIHVRVPDQVQRDALAVGLYMRCRAFSATVPFPDRIFTQRPGRDGKSSLRHDAARPSRAGPPAPSLERKHPPNIHPRTSDFSLALDTLAGDDAPATNHCHHHQQTSLLPKTAAPLRAALAILDQLEEGNADPASPTRKLSKYSVDILYAPPTMMCTPEKPVDQYRVAAYPDAFRRHEFHDTASSLVGDFLRRTEGFSAGWHAAGHSGGHAAEEDVGDEEEAELRKENRALAVELAEIHAATSSLETRIDGAKGKKELSAAGANGKKKPEGERGSPTTKTSHIRDAGFESVSRTVSASDNFASAVRVGDKKAAPVKSAAHQQRLALKEKDAAAMSLAAAPRVWLPDGPLEKIDVAALLKRTSLMPPPHDPAILPHAVKRWADRRKTRTTDPNNA
ncbi:hypothetical protein DIPPA_33773 [Diplonema papillatum]|nr:hypothetical protein DIPPA_33773 [Diplonema papillatum]KAJ9456504.1 hypothetical protein DIPPA_33773 [Diplonema papillatum]